MKFKNKTWLIVLMVALLIQGIYPIQGNASSDIILLKGQSVYVPVYSHIYYGDRDKPKPFDLTVTLSIRNTDPKQEIVIFSVDYFDSEGNLLKHYLEKSKHLKNLGTIRYVIKKRDKTGGSGAKFIVRWKSKELVNAPLIEAIMISTESSQGISFISRGQAIQE